MTRLEQIYRAAEARKARAEAGQKIPPELFQTADAYLTPEERQEAHQLKQALPTFGELQAQARARLESRRRGRARA